MVSSPINKVSVFNTNDILKTRHPEQRKTRGKTSHRRGGSRSPGLFLGGVELLRNGVTDWWRKQIPVVLESRRSSGGGAQPLHPPPRSSPASRKDNFGLLGGIVLQRMSCVAEENGGCLLFTYSCGSRRKQSSCLAARKVLRILVIYSFVSLCSTSIEIYLYLGSTLSGHLSSFMVKWARRNDGRELYYLFACVF